MRIVLAIPLLLLLALLPWSAGPAGAAEKKTFRVGVLFWHESPNDELAFKGVQSGFALARLQVATEIIYARADADRARSALRRWRDQGYDLVYAMGTSASLVARAVLTELPVVFTAVTNPVGSGVVPNWEGSGTNLCGNSNWIDTSAVLTVFRNAVPDLARLGVVLNRDNPVSIEEVAEAKRYFRDHPRKRLALFEEYLRGPEDLEQAVTKLLERGAQAVWVPIDFDVYRNIDKVTALTAPRGIPVVTSQASAVKTGAVVGVAVDYHTLGERSVILAEQVLCRGADPGKLPVGRLSSYRVLVNLGAARRAKFELPLALLATADEILDPGRDE
jgi:putative ABC transport system substrate-binding protein